MHSLSFVWLSVAPFLSVLGLCSATDEETILGIMNYHRFDEGCEATFDANNFKWIALFSRSIELESH